MLFSSVAKPIRTHFKTPEGKFRLRQAVSHPAGKLYSLFNRTTKLSFAPRYGIADGAPHPALASSTAVSPGTPSSSPASPVAVAPLPPAVKPLTAQGASSTEEPEEHVVGPVDNVYMLVNVGDSVYFMDFTALEKDPLEHQRWRATPSCHEINLMSSNSERLDLLIGFSTGDILLQDPLRKTSSTFNKDGCISSSRVQAMRWIPGSTSLFMVAHADGNMFLYDKDRESEQPIAASTKDPDLFSVTQNKLPKQNPLARWHINRSTINDIAFTADGKYIATVSRDGILRVFHFEDESLVVAFKSYFGALLCVCWSPDGKFLLTGGEDDLVTIWAFKERSIVARCEGHLSWISGVAFDPWACDLEHERYRFGSVGQDARLLLWDFSYETLNLPKKIATARRESIYSLQQPASPATGSSLLSGATQSSSHPATGSTSSPHSMSIPHSSSSSSLPSSLLLPVNSISSNAVSPIITGSLSLQANISMGSNSSTHGHGHVLSSPSLATGAGTNGTYPIVPVFGLADVPIMYPIVECHVHQEPIAALQFLPNAVVTSCFGGVTKVWQRPAAKQQQPLTAVKSVVVVDAANIGKSNMQIPNSVPTSQLSDLLNSSQLDLSDAPSPKTFPRKVDSPSPRTGSAIGKKGPSVMKPPNSLSTT
mmetsp:Transcript_1629/g.2878  ORF Transcript_1629/g.2878 Transcript_1629/m.2878 type:complete len:651 (-) Transcript_1629:317-2269(-)